jgi:hypothetical protein
MRSYAMRGAVPVSFAAHLINTTVTRKVSALNPALRIPLTVTMHYEKDTATHNNRTNFSDFLPI